MKEGLPSRRRVVVVVVALVLAVVAALVLRSRTGAVRPVEPLPFAAAATMVPVDPAGTAPIGPTSRHHGVSVGWRHDPAGAVAAATGYVQAIGLVATAGPLERPDIIDTFTTGSYGPSLIAKTDQQLDDLFFDLGARGHTAGDLTWGEYPVAAHTNDSMPDQIRVDVWSVSVIVVSGAAVARQVWHTDTVGLVWQDDDWKVDAWTTAPGPTPGLDSEVDLSPATAVRVNVGWPPVNGGS